MTVFHRTLTLLLLLLLWYVHSIHMQMQLIKFLCASLIKFNALSSVCIQISMQLNGIHRLPSYGNCDVHKLFGIFSGLKRFQWSHNFKTSVNIQDFPRFFLSQKWFLPKKLNSDVMRYFRQANKCLFTHLPRKGKLIFHPHIYDSWIKRRHVLKLVISRSIYIPRICHIIMLWAWAMRTMSNKPKHPRLNCLSFACIKWVFTFCWLSVCRMPAVDI